MEEGVHNLRTGRVELGVHPLNLGQFSKTHAFSLDTGFHNSGFKVLVNP